MDPNATLRELREATEAWRREDELAEDGERMLNIAAGVVELTAALDTWLSNGGFLPADWSRPGE